MSTVGGPKGSNFRDIFNSTDLLYWYDMSLPTSTTDLDKHNTIDTSDGYDSYTRLYDLSGNGFHLYQSVKSSQPVVVDNIYTTVEKKLSRSITSASFADGEATARFMTGLTSNSDLLVFDDWTLYLVFQHDGHFRFVPNVFPTSLGSPGYDTVNSENTRNAIFYPLGNIKDVDPDDAWTTLGGEGAIWHWRNSNSVPTGTGPLTFRGYGYGNSPGGNGFDISAAPRDVKYPYLKYGLPAGYGLQYYDSTRELELMDFQVEAGVSATMNQRHNFDTREDNTISPSGSLTGRYPCRLQGGRIAEAIFFRKAHTDQERLYVNRMLSNKWRIKITE